MFQREGSPTPRPAPEERGAHGPGHQALTLSPAPKSQNEEVTTAAQETARPSTPRLPAPGRRRWALRKARPRHPRSSRRPPRPPKASGRSATAQSPEPRGRHPPPPPRTPTLSIRIDPSPAAAGTSSGRRYGGRVSPLRVPSLTSFPVWAGGGGATTEWEELSAREGSPRPPPRTSGSRPHLLPPQVGRGREETWRPFWGPGEAAVRAGARLGARRGKDVSVLASSSSGKWALERGLGLIPAC